jgi:hypothetical protein
VTGGALMAKYCMNCRHALRDDDKYCAECGTAVSDLVAPPPPPRWETCDITYQEVKPAGLFTKAQGQFIAAAMGRVGRYVAAESGVFVAAANGEPDLHDPHHLAELTALVDWLTTDRWEVLPEKLHHPVFGYIWFGYRFRRLVSS